MAGPSRGTGSSKVRGNYRPFSLDQKLPSAVTHDLSLWLAATPGQRLPDGTSYRAAASNVMQGAKAQLAVMAVAVWRGEAMAGHRPSIGVGHGCNAVVKIPISASLRGSAR